MRKVLVMAAFAVLVAACSSEHAARLGGVEVDIVDGVRVSDPGASSGAAMRLDADRSTTFVWSDETLDVRWRRGGGSCGDVTVSVLPSGGGDLRTERYDVRDAWDTATIPVGGEDATIEIDAGNCPLLVDHLTNRSRAWSRRGLAVPIPPEAIVEAADGVGADADAARIVETTPTAVWLTGDEPARLAADTIQHARTERRVPVLVVYGRPDRDCGGQSAGGSADHDDYLAGLRGVADAIGDTATIVIVEPDATSEDCGANRARAELLTDAVAALDEAPGARVYLDAGHPGWLDVDEQVGRLESAGVADADGVAVNVSNFASPAAAADYARAIVEQVGGGYVLDVSRSGAPVPDGEWCNPPEARVGPDPTVDPADPRQDAALWVKRPGESDGTCNGGPPAGQWWPTGAVRLFSTA